MSLRLSRFAALAVLPIFAGCSRTQVPAQAQVAPARIAVAAANDADVYPELRIGGKGAAPGQFADLRDFSFAPDGTIWTLEGPGKRRGPGGNASYSGNNRVQHLSAEGKPLGQFPLEGNGSPFRLAADASGNVYVTFWDENRVAAYASDGRLIKNWDVPFALGLAPYQNGMAVTSGNVREGADKIVVINGATSREIKLSQSLTRVGDLTTDNKGNFWIVAWMNQVYQFDQNGQLKQTIGAGTNARKGDGSEWFEAIALQNDGTLLGMDANTITRRAPAGTLTLRPDSIGQHATYNRLQTVRVDKKNRIWAADFNMPQGNQPDASRPIIARLASDAFDANAPGAPTVAATGDNATLESALAGNIAYDLQPFALTLKMPVAKREIESAQVNWIARDTNKNSVGQGNFNVDLSGNRGALQSFSWTPPQFGWYQVTATISISHGADVLQRAVALCGVTPPFANLPKFEQVAGLDRRADVPRQMFVGMPAIRLDATGEDWLAIDEKVVPLAQKYGANVWLQFVEPKDVKPDWVTKVARQFKGRVRYYEFINEPDLKMKPDEYIKLIRPAVAALRAADPDARVLGPATVQIRLDWMKQFLQAGGGDLIDEWDFHAYEGHESTDPNYLRAKLTAMRALLKQNGKGDIPLWQGEHAIAAQRASVIWPDIQAERWVSDRDVFEQFGIPVERDMFFYLNPRGYGKVPSYAWTNQGPMALSLVARARYAMTRDLKYAGALDFGATGNGLFTGLRFDGNDGQSVVSLRAGDVADGGKLGLSREFNVNARNIVVVDAWGNERNVPVENNRVTLELRSLPTYVRLPRGVKMTPIALNLGRNIARQATFEAPGATNVGVLNDGLLQSIHQFEPGYNLPPSDTNAGQIFRDTMAPVGDDNIKPAVVTARWKTPQKVRTILIKGIRADNQHCALLDYDVEIEINGKWQNFASVKADVPASELGGAMDTPLTSWSHDRAINVVSVPVAVAATAVRITARRATRGLIPDQFAIEARRGLKTYEEPMSLDLAEIEIYG